MGLGDTSSQVVSVSASLSFFSVAARVLDHQFGRVGDLPRFPVVPRCSPSDRARRGHVRRSLAPSSCLWHSPVWRPVRLQRRPRKGNVRLVPGRPVSDIMGRRTTVRQEGRMDRQVVHDELRQASVAFHRLLDTAAAEDLRRPSQGTRWNKEQLLFHMVFGYMVVRALSSDSGGRTSTSTSARSGSGSSGNGSEGRRTRTIPRGGAVGRCCRCRPFAWPLCGTSACGRPRCVSVRVIAGRRADTSSPRVRGGRRAAQRVPLVHPGRRERGPAGHPAA